MHRSTVAGRAFALSAVIILCSAVVVSAQKPERVSVSTFEVQDNNSASSGSYITPDGRYVVFQTGANLEPADTNNSFDIYVRDRITGKTARVSIPDPGVTGSPTNANGGCTLGRAGVRYCSDDGRHVVFQSSASNLVNNDHNGEQHVAGMDVFVRDRDFDGNGIYDEPGVGKTKTVRVSVSSGESEWHEFSIGLDTYSGGCDSPSISANGKIVAFHCQGSPFDPSGEHGTTGANCYARNRDNDNDNVFDEAGSAGAVDQSVTLLVSKLRCNCTGDQFDGFSYDPAVSGNGRFVAFVTASQLLDYDTVFDSDSNQREDVYVRDLQGGSGSIMRASVDTNEDDISSSSGDPSISYDGRYIAFTTGGSLLIPRSNDNNATTDIYVRDRGNFPNGNYIFSIGSTSRVSYATSLFNAFIQMSAASDTPFISSDGTSIAFVTAQNGVNCGFLPPCPDQNNKKDVYVRHLTSGTDWSTANVNQFTYRASRTSALGDADGDSIFPSVADGGGAVAYASVATNIVLPDDNGALSDVYAASQVIGSEPYITSVVSRKWHGANAFDITLPLDSGASSDGIEDRAEGPSELVVTFSQPVHLLSGPALTAPNLILDSYIISGNDVIFEVHGAVDTSCAWFQVGDFGDSDNDPIDGQTTVYYRYLQGDFNAGTVVNSTDIANIKARSGQTATAANFRADIYPDGEIDAADIIRVKARQNNGVTTTCN